MKFTQITLFIAAFALVGILLNSTPTIQAGGSESKIPSLFDSSFSYEAIDNMDQSINDTLKILRIDPDHYLANYRAGWLYNKKGRYKDSLRFYKRAAALKPKALDVKLAMMVPLMAANKLSRAKKIAENVLESNPNNYLALSRLAYICFSQGDYISAEENYESVLEAYPSDIEMMLGLGWARVRMGKKEEARAMFAEVLSIHRNNLNARAGIEALW